MNRAIEHIRSNPQIKAGMVDYLKARRAERLESLARAPTMDDVRRFQGKVAELDDMIAELAR